MSSHWIQAENWEGDGVESPLSTFDSRSFSPPPRPNLPHTDTTSKACTGPKYRESNEFGRCGENIHNSRGLST